MKHLTLIGNERYSVVKLKKKFLIYLADWKKCRKFVKHLRQGWQYVIKPLVSWISKKSSQSTWQMKKNVVTLSNNSEMSETFFEKQDYPFNEFVNCNQTVTVKDHYYHLI